MNSAEEIRDALRRFRRRGIRRWNSQRAAMAIPVVTGPGGPAVLLTRRADAVGTPRGQLALPSDRTGRWESASAGARRHLSTDLGIQLPPESVLGALDDYLTLGTVVITPLVLWVGPVGARQVPITDFLAVPLADLDAEPVFVAGADCDRPTIRLPLHGEWLHAPAAAVLHQFREVVLYGRPTRVTAFSGLSAV